MKTFCTIIISFFISCLGLQYGYSSNSFLTADSSLLVLTNGLTQIGTKDGIVCTVEDLDDSSYAIIFGDEDTYSNEYVPGSYPAVARAVFKDEGRVVALGHEFYATGALPEYDNMKFILNAVKFLDKQNTNKILIDKGHEDWLDLSYGLVDSLTKQGFVVETTIAKLNSNNLEGYGVLLIGNSWGDYMPTEYSSVESFVKNGNGLFLMGLGWSWVAYNQDRTLEDYPMNQFAKIFGLKFINDSIKDPTNNINNDISRVLFHNFYPTIPNIEEPPDRPYRILIDQSHDYTFLWDWKMGSDYLARAGIKYSRNMATLDSVANPDIFKYDVMMIPQVYSNADFLPEEIESVKEFVQSGGGLLLVGVGFNKPDTADYPIHKLAKEFGISFNTTVQALKSFKIYEHDITMGVSEYQSEALSIGCISVPPDWDIFLTDTQNKIIGAAGSYGNGRVVTFADHNIINFDATHNHLLVQNIASWLSENLAGDDSTFVPAERIYPENTLQQGLITYRYSKNLEQRVMFLYNNYDTVTAYLKQLMSVDCIYNLNILALGSGGGGYSGGSEIGIGVLASDEYTLAVFAHELTHSWQHPGGEVPWMGEGWAVLSAERVCRMYGGIYEQWAENEYLNWQSIFRQYDPMGKNVDITEYGSTRMSVPNGVYTGKVIWIIEDLENKYGNDLMSRYFQLRRKYYNPSQHGGISTQKTVYFLSWAAGKELYTYFRSKRTLVDPIDVHPVVFNTIPENNDTLTYTNSNFSITFNAPMNASTLNFETIKVIGSISGQMTGTITYVDSTRTAHLNPSVNFSPGETVTVEITRNVQDIYGFALDGDGSQTSEATDSYMFSFIVGSTTKLKTGENQVIPYKYNLSPNYPNPFNNSTFFSFSLPHEINVTLQVKNLLGQQVAELITNEKYVPGKYEICWDAGDLASGIYCLILKTDDYQAQRKILLLK